MPTPAAAKPRRTPATPPPHTEFELRLHLPPGQEAALRRALRLPAPAARAQRLQAVYFDTPNGDLARAGLGLRLRREGRRWVQTVKGGAAHALLRGEHNAPLPALPAGLEPAVDPARHAGSPVGEQLLACLARVRAQDGAGAARLVEGFRTDIRRERQRLRRRAGQVELAFDRGQILAPDGQGGWRRWPVQELELECVGGSPRAVLDLGARALALGLRLELRSKAERGWRLAAALGPEQPGPARPAWPARAPALDASTPVAEWAAALRGALAGPLLRNAGELAGGQGSPAALHPLRVGLRRLRAVEALCKDAPGVAPLASGAGLRALFRALGPARDADALGQGLAPRLAAAWATAGLSGTGPSLAGADPNRPSPVAEAAAVLLRPDSQAALLQLLVETSLPADMAAGSWTAPPTPAGGPGPAPTAAGWAAARLKRWHRRLRRAAAGFDAMPDEARHALRKGLKRLRYGLDACAPWLPRPALKAQLRALAAAQEALGAFQDLCTAEARLQEAMAAGQAPAAFALGWLRRERDLLLRQARRALRRWRAVALPRPGAD